MRKIKVLITLNSTKPEWRVPAGVITRLKRDFPGVSFSSSPKDIKSADVVFDWTIGGAALKKARRLKWFHTAGVQYADILPKGLYKKAVVTNSRGVWGEYISGEFFRILNKASVAAELALPNLGKGQSKLCRYFAATKFAGRTAGIIGLGGMGECVARKAKRLGMRVLAVKRRPKSRPDFADRLLPPSRLMYLLKNSDFIFLTAPLTKETAGLLGKGEFKAMKRGAYLLSASRPGLIDRRAMLNALSNGRLKTAVIDDVWPPELKRCKGVVMFPHASPLRHNIWPAMFDIFAKNLKRFIMGRPLLNRIDPCKRSY